MALHILNDSIAKNLMDLYAIGENHTVKAKRFFKANKVIAKDVLREKTANR